MWRSLKRLIWNMPLCICILVVSNVVVASSYDSKHVEVSLRMIGHQLLLSANDSVSKVLPIVKEGNKYKVQFETEFEFNPDELVNISNDVIEKTKIAEAYIIEVVECSSGDVVYSYEMGDIDKVDVIACRSRNYEKGCYSLVLMLSDTKSNEGEGSTEAVFGQSPYLWGTAALFLLLFLGYWIWRKRSSVENSNIHRIGKYQFNTNRGVLLLNEDITQLTGKESELLLLLYGSRGNTVERDVILNKVWGDEGVYIGRTLDVFISKLRKKLEEDPNVKIANIRGVGYKLVTEV